ncbi:MAG: hypothetical protein OEU54_10285, partial [Gemmatimonadota bacterium]|nr:hypothetical protein [Gemmatimonadota bacterium]
HWMPLAWALMIFVLQIQYWFGLEDLNTAISDWNWIWYGQAIFVAVLIFMAGALVLPTREGRVAGGLIKDFEAHGRLSLLALAAYFLGWLGLNAKLNGSLFIFANLLNVMHAGLAVAAFFSTRSRTRGWITVGFALLLLYTLIFVYSTPGPERTG